MVPPDFFTHYIWIIGPLSGWTLVVIAIVFVILLSLYDEDDDDDEE